MIISISGKMKSGKDTVAQMIQLLSENYNDSDIVLIVKGELSEWRNETKNRIWEIKKFAYKVKEVASILTGIPVEDFNRQEVKDQILPEEWNYWTCDGKIFSTEQEAHNESDELWSEEGWDAPCEEGIYTVRELLQRIGTEAIRNQIHPNAWCTALFTEYIESDIELWKDISGYENKYQISKLPKSGSNWIITDTRFPNEVKAVKDRNGITIRINRTYDPSHDMIGTDATSWKAPSIHPSETSLDSYEDWDYIIDNNGSLEDLLEKVKEIYEKIKIN